MSWHATFCHNCDFKTDTSCCVDLSSQVDARRLKKVNIRDAVISAGILYDKERLERGQSTANADMRVLSTTLQELEEQERELKRSLGDLGVTGVRDDGD